MFKKKFLFVLLSFSLLNIQKNYSQLSKKHFIPPLTYAEAGNASPDNQYFYISTPSQQNVAFTIKKIGQTSTSDIKGVVSKNNPQEVFLGNGDGQLFVDSRQTSVVHSNKGYIIESDDVIYVSLRMIAGGGPQAGALVSKGSSALGTVFRAGMYTNENPITNNYLNFISVMATENNTSVSFKDLPTGISIKNYSGTIPITGIVLNEGESYIVATNASDNNINKDGLIGTLIESDKAIVVNTGSANGSFHNGGGRDYGIDQIVEFSKVGNEYIFVKGGGSDGWENVLIVSHQDNTTISINGNTNVATINAGDYYLIEGNNYNSNGNMYVKTSKDVFAYQGVGQGGSEANQGMFFVPPLSCENRGKVDNIPNIDSIGSLTFNGGVSIVTNKGATVTINGQPITNFSPSGPFDVDGNTNYVTYKVVNLSNNISIESSEELYCAYFNLNGAATSGSFYSGFPSSPEINFNASVSTLGNCIPNVTLEAANTDLFDSFEWFFDDENGGGYIATGITTASYAPNLPGKYKLKAKITCTGAEFESIEVPVSLCPDDYDGDSVIDNLDIDLDNDGILNCEESIGNATLNLTNTSSPSIIFQDNSTNTAIVSSSFTQNSSGTVNTITGQNNGNFTTTLNPEITSNLEYTLNFTQNINLKFTQNSGTNHTISNGEFFVIKIGPNNKNLTLLDPDNQLLVDTNFDGVFESGITTLSASEIHFTYNSAATGATPFQFIANQVNQVIFQHNSNSLSTTSTFNGNFQLTCFSLDSDSDGIENMFDLDSDNDGIPDITEAFSQEITISGIDANLDGLDDVFTSNINLDIDGDGVKNYIDLDSDNDGIFDSTEAGHNLDTNFDGLIDNVNTIVGINGLANSLETVPDSKSLSINYTITNTDEDLDFNFVELDSDNDNCLDVTEAGFTDNDNNGIIDTTSFGIDSNGKVINNLDGYTLPNPNYITSAPIIINTPFENQTFCENSSDIITINSTADSFQWQVSSNGTTWNNITNNTNYNGATTKDLQITSPPLSFNNYKFRVLLNRTGNSCQTISNEITLTVSPQPIVRVANLLQCDNDLDRISTINLTEAEINISGNYQNETFKYYATEAHAIAGTPEVTDKLRYPVNQIGEAWVRTISKDNCYSISKINLRIDAANDVAYNKEFPAVCDDFLDKDGNNTTNNSDTDGITNFNFSIANSEILAFFPLALQPDLEVSFYETDADRTAVINQIPDISNYRNTNYPSNITKQTIYFKITNKNNNDCSGIGELYLRTKSVPIANSPSNFSLCDDASSGSTIDGENSNINLRDKVADILGPNQSETDYLVTFHTSEKGANNNSDLITNDTNFRNSAPAGFSVGDISEQTIYVRVQNKNGATICYNAKASFKVSITPNPTVSNNITPLAVCDVVTTTDSDPRNRVAQNIDISSKNSEILAGRTNMRVAYYTTQSDAENNLNEITNISNYQNEVAKTVFPTNFNSDEPASQTIFFVVIDENGNKCRSVFQTFNILIYPEPNIPLNISNYTDCDNDSDSFNDDDNGINANISLKNKIPEILANYTPAQFTDFSVTFYNSLANAQSGNKTLALNENNYQNTTNNETIFVRVENTKNTPVVCVNTKLSFQIEIKPLPSFSVTGEDSNSPQIICLNDTPLTLEAQNPGATYNYQWKDESNAVIGNAATLNITSGGKYFVTATDQNTTGCSRTRTIHVKESNPATLNPNFVTIVDEANNIGAQNKLSVLIDTVTNNLGPGEYQFALRNDDDNTTTPFQDQPLFENIEGGIYTIIVNDKNGCVPDATLQISVLQFPKFFTPNGDGDNDTWEVKGANKSFYPNSSINVFNRFGKLVAQLPIDGGGWNGTYNGKKLPSDDYWYSITLIPADKNKQPINKKGNFSLIRR